MAISFHSDTVMYSPFSTSGQLPAGTFGQLSPEHFSISPVELVFPGQYEAAANCEKKRNLSSKPWSMPICSVASLGSWEVLSWRNPGSQSSESSPQSRFASDAIQPTNKTKRRMNSLIENERQDIMGLFQRRKTRPVD